MGNPSRRLRAEAQSWKKSRPRSNGGRRSRMKLGPWRRQTTTASVTHNQRRAAGQGLIGSHGISYALSRPWITSPVTEPRHQLPTDCTYYPGTKVGHVGRLSRAVGTGREARPTEKPTPAAHPTRPRAEAGARCSPA